MSTATPASLRLIGVPLAFNASFAAPAARLDYAVVPAARNAATIDSADVPATCGNV
jgi:hypothetical protein